MEQQKSTTLIKECPVCKSTEFGSYLSTRDYFLTNETFELVECKKCNLIFTNPIPQLTNLAKYYDSPDYLSHTASKWSITSAVYNFLRNQNLKGKYKLISQFKKSGSVLDIGQGTGEFLNYLQKRNWKVQGVEPNESARNFAIQNYNLPVVDEKEIDSLAPKSFDLITMWHVLEHVPDLQKRMEQIKTLLKKDGILIIAVPNLNSPDAVKYKEKWAALDVPRHLYHFTSETMNSLFKQFGFSLVEKYPLKLDAYYVSLLSEKYLNNSFPYPKAFLSGMKSNKMAKKENNYSSMIFIAKPN